MKYAAFIAVTVALSACASTPPPVDAPLTPRPVTEIKSETIDVPAMIKDADELYEARDYAGSLKGYQTALFHNPGLIDAQLGAGNAALALGQKADALKAFSNLQTDTLSQDQKAKLLAGLALLTADRSVRQDTEAHLKHVLQYTPGDARLWIALGKYYDENEQWVESTEAYVTALTTGHARASIINNLGMSLLMQGRRSEALAKFDQAHDIEPDVELYDNNRRLVFVLRGDYDKALSGLNTTRSARLFNDAGFIAMQAGDRSAARMLLNRAIAVNPVYDAKAHANLKVLETG